MIHLAWPNAMIQTGRTVSMKKPSRQIAASLPAVQQEREQQALLHQLFVQDPEKCLQVIRRWLAADRSKQPQSPQERRSSTH